MTENSYSNVHFSVIVAAELGTELVHVDAWANEKYIVSTNKPTISDLKSNREDIEKITDFLSLIPDTFFSIL